MTPGSHGYRTTRDALLALATERPRVQPPDQPPPVAAPPTPGARPSPWHPPSASRRRDRHAARRPGGGPPRRPGRRQGDLARPAARHRVRGSSASTSTPAGPSRPRAAARRPGLRLRARGRRARRWCAVSRPPRHTSPRRRRRPGAAGQRLGRRAGRAVRRAARRAAAGARSRRRPAPASPQRVLAGGVVGRDRPAGRRPHVGSASPCPPTRPVARLPGWRCRTGSTPCRPTTASGSWPGWRCCSATASPPPTSGRPCATAASVR